SLATPPPRETLRNGTPRRVRPAPEPPGIGTVLGKYELVGRLGRGTTSVVYRGRHLKLKMPVAVKVLHADELAHSPQLLGQLVSVDPLSRQAAEGPSDTMPAGTAAYLAPEQACNPSRVDFRADVYSLGATLYHALTSLFPFEGRTSMQVIVKHLREALVPPRHYLPDLTEEQSDLIVKMMAKEPAERFDTYDDLRQALARAVGDRRAPRPLAQSF